MLKKISGSIFAGLFFWIYAITAQVPANYYEKAIGKQGAELKTALHDIIRPHTILEYYTSSTYFRTTDWHPDGYFWDMYSSYKRPYWSGMNREHNLPKSWWSANPESTDAYSDLHNLYPSDADANSAKLNYPLGVVNSSPTYSNGVVKVGTNTYSGYAGTVFEPANEYKGDFARDYMYVVTCYEDYASYWRSTGLSSMLQRNTYPVLSPYAIKLLLEWHRADPVSQKEINRNNAVYNLQNNRNPFIDHPLLAEYIWGKFTAEIWDGTNDEPETNTPLIYSYSPTKHTVFVKLKKPSKASYAIYSLSGTLKQSGNMDTSSEITLKDQNTNNEYEKGVYILSVYAGARRKTVKLIIY